MILKRERHSDRRTDNSPYIYQLHTHGILKTMHTMQSECYLHTLKKGNTYNNYGMIEKLIEANKFRLINKYP